MVIVTADRDNATVTPAHTVVWWGDGNAPGAPWLVGTHKIDTGRWPVNSTA